MGEQKEFEFSRVGKYAVMMAFLALFSGIGMLPAMMLAPIGGNAVEQSLNEMDLTENDYFATMYVDFLKSIYEAGSLLWIICLMGVTALLFLVVFEETNAIEDFKQYVVKKWRKNHESH